MIEIKQGVFAPPFGQQFPALIPDCASMLDKCNIAITQLYICGLITDAENTRIRTKRFPKFVASTVKENSND